MKVFLSNMCTSLVGLLNPELGYFLVERKSGFFSQRSRWGAPRDGHWRFIVLCAELAQNRLYISDIEVSPSELLEALSEAGLQGPALAAKPASTFSAEDILSIKSNVIRQNPSAYEVSCKSSISLLMQLDEAETPN